MEGQQIDGESQQKEDTAKRHTYPLIRVHTKLFNSLNLRYSFLFIYFFLNQIE